MEAIYLCRWSMLLGKLLINERLPFYTLTAKRLEEYKLKEIINKCSKKILKESQRLYKRPGKQYSYIHQVVYNNKLEHKCTLTLLDPRLLYISPYMLRDTCLLETLVQIYTAACLYYVYYV